MKQSNRLVGFVSCHKKGIALSGMLLIAGACLGWEIREVDDARTGKPITRSQGIIFPWQPCGAKGRGTQINFHVRQWLCYGLIKLEATGQTL
jgi:hypothetical protein